MQDLALLPPMIGGHLLAELQAAGISAGSSDLAPGSLGALPGLAAPSMTVWIEDEAQLEKARAILERILKSLNLDGSSGNLHGQDEIRADQAFDSPQGFLEDAGNHSPNLEGDPGVGDDG